MTTVVDRAGSAELWLISDFPIDESHLGEIRQLFGEGTSEDDIAFRPGRRCCRWPLRVPYPTRGPTSLSFHVFLCAGFLKQRRKVIDRIHALGCNLELCVHVPGLTEYFSIAAGTLQQLAELDIQFSLMPPGAEDRAGGAGAAADPGL